MLCLAFVWEVIVLLRISRIEVILLYLLKNDKSFVPFKIIQFSFIMFIQNLLSWTTQKEHTAFSYAYCISNKTKKFMLYLPWFYHEANREDMEESDLNVMINWEYNASNRSLHLSHTEDTELIMLIIGLELIIRFFASPVHYVAFRHSCFSNIWFINSIWLLAYKQMVIP